MLVKRLQPGGGRYREGGEYRLLRHIHNGSYGDVYRVRDAATGFTCAAKRVRHWGGGEEVGLDL